MTLLELVQLMRRNLVLVIVLPLVCALVAAAVSWLCLPNEYTSSVTLYVLSKNATDQNAQSVTNSELNASQMLTNDVVTLMKSERVSDAAAQTLGVSSLKDFEMNITSASTTRVITLKVTGTDPTQTAAVANAVAKATDSVAQSVMDVKSVNIIDTASVPKSPSGPPRLLYTAVAFLAGLFIAIVILVVRDTFDTRIRTPEEVESLIGLPVLGRIPKVRA